MIELKKKLLKLKTVAFISLMLFLVSCQNASKEEVVHKHEVEIKPIQIQMKVDVTVTDEKKEETKKEDPDN